jgi:hypothetical protein
LPLINDALIRGQQSEELPVERSVRWNSSTNSECGPGSAEYHLAKLYERPLQEAAPPVVGRRQVSHHVQADTFSNPM